MTGVAVQKNKTQHNRNRGQMRRRHDSDDEPYTRKRQLEFGRSRTLRDGVSNGRSKASARNSWQIQRGHTHTIIETDSTAAKANAERPRCRHMQYISVMSRLFARCSRNQRGMRKVGTTKNSADRLTKPVTRQVLQNRLDALKIELTDSQQVNTSINMVTIVQKELMDESERQTPGVRGVNPSTGHTSLEMHARQKIRWESGA